MVNNCSAVSFAAHMKRDVYAFKLYIIKILLHVDVEMTVVWMDNQKKGRW